MLSLRVDCHGLMPLIRVPLPRTMDPSRTDCSFWGNMNGSWAQLQIHLQMYTAIRSITDGNGRDTQSAARPLVVVVHVLSPQTNQCLPATQKTSCILPVYCILASTILTGWIVSKANSNFGTFFFLFERQVDAVHGKY